MLTTLRHLARRIADAVERELAFASIRYDPRRNGHTTSVYIGLVRLRQSKPTDARYTDPGQVDQAIADIVAGKTVELVGDDVFNAVLTALVDVRVAWQDIATQDGTPRRRIASMTQYHTEHEH